MSAHAGVLLFDGRPSPDAEAAISAALRPIAPDGVSLYSSDDVVMGYGATESWSEEPHRSQPLRSPGGLVATWDGRLDNRHDLRLRFGLAAREQSSDASIALAAFERSGIDGLRSLVGEWSLAIWDSERRVLHLARDYMGVRPLFYCADDYAMRWSSSLGDLVQRCHCADELSEAFVAGFMTSRFRGEITPYESILAVPAATCVSVTKIGATTRRRFWRLDAAAIRYRDARQYEEHLRALWQESVGARLRTARPVWAELSGGLDSSSVVCMGDWLIKNGRVPAPAIEPISHVTLTSPEGDERRFIAEVEAQIGVSSHVLGVEENDCLTNDDWECVTPFAANGVGLAQNRHILARDGRIVLSGRVGDVVMGCEPDNSVAVFDDLADGRVVDALANMRRWSRASRKPFIEIARQLVARVTARSAVRAVLHHSATSTMEGAALLSPRLIEALPPVDTEMLSELSRVRRSKRDLWALTFSYAAGSRLNIPYSDSPIVRTYPFTHRPLVEFVVAIPGSQISAPGDMRSLMRRAFAGLVPERILRRTSKGYYPPSATRAARPLAAALRPVERLEVVRRGWIDPSSLDEAIGRMLDAGDAGAAVRSVIRLEQWLTSRSKRSAAIPERKEVRSHEVLEA